MRNKGAKKKDISSTLEIAVNFTNALNQTPLYPMNANAGGPGLQPGAPALEKTSLWARLAARF